MTHIVSEESAIIAERDFWDAIKHQGKELDPEIVRRAGAQSQMALINRHYPDMDPATMRRADRTYTWLANSLSSDPGYW